MQSLTHLQRALGSLCFGLVVGLVPGPAWSQGAETPWWSALDSLPEGTNVIALDSLYAVRGTTAEGIGLELQAFGPRRDGRTFHGLHQAPWRWRFSTERTALGTCRLTEFTLVIRSTITLPHLEPDPQRPPALQDAWDAYLSSLRTHEEGHRGITVRELRRFRARAAASTPRPCDQFQAHFEAMTRDVEARIRDAQEAYDRDTDFGRTQGAVWNPSTP